MKAVTVIGGGLAGLAAAITAAELGASVTLHEAHRTVGGRWRSTPVRKRPRTDAVYRAHEGPHVIYRDGPIWPWLRERGLLGVTCGVPLGAVARFRFWHAGRVRAVPPAGFLRALRACRRTDVPIDQSFRTWASKLVGLEAAYRQGSWGAMFDGIAEYARKLGVIIELGSRVSSIGNEITIVATELESARVLLGADSLDWPSGRTALLDLGVHRNRHDLFVVSDLDTCGWMEIFTMPDPTIAPAGEHLVQMQMPISADSSKADGVARLEAIADQCKPAVET